MSRRNSSPIHELKCWPKHFSEIVTLIRRFDTRINDRNFQQGDGVWLREWNPETKEYTGREARTIITFVSKDFKGLEPDYVVLGLGEVT